jgi:hypothetical protein
VGGNWVEDYVELEEWNDHENRGKGEGHGQWKK